MLKEPFGTRLQREKKIPEIGDSEIIFADCTGPLSWFIKEVRCQKFSKSRESNNQSPATKQDSWSTNAQLVKDRK